MSEAFGSEEELREALEEVAEALPGSYVEEPWSSAAVAAAAAVASGAAPGLATLARQDLERVADSSELLEVADDAEGLRSRLDEPRDRLA